MGTPLSIEVKRVHFPSLHPRYCCIFNNLGGKIFTWATLQFGYYGVFLNIEHSSDSQVQTIYE